MKEWRIIRLTPTLAIVNVQVSGAVFTGYTNHGVAERDLEALRRVYPAMRFEIVEYVELDC